MRDGIIALVLALAGLWFTTMGKNFESFLMGGLMLLVALVIVFT